MEEYKKIFLNVKFSDTYGMDSSAGHLAAQPCRFHTLQQNLTVRIPSLD